MLSYSLSIIKNWLEKENNYKWIKCSSIPGLYATGLRISFNNIQNNSIIYMSIQTDPTIAGRAFAETAILNSNEYLIYPIELGYDDVLKHYTPEQLFEHIKYVKLQLESNDIFISVLEKIDVYQIL